jgi:hypothetical protein
MANPSDVGPSGAGTEVLRRWYDSTVDSSSETVMINGVADHIYTVLSVVAFNPNAACVFHIRFYAEGTGSEMTLVKADIPQNGTFVFSDKIVIAGADELRVLTATTDDIIVHCTYIDQEF